MANSKFVTGDMLDRTVKNIAQKTDARYILKKSAISAVLPCVSKEVLEEELEEELEEVEGWIYDDENETGYPYYYDLPVAGVTENNMAVASVPFASQNTAQACGLCPSNNTLTGYVRFYTVAVPSTEIAINLWIL